MCNNKSKPIKGIEPTINKTDNEICDKGACALSEALKINTTLAALNLGRVQQQRNTHPGHENNNRAKQIVLSTMVMHVN